MDGQKQYFNWLSMILKLNMKCIKLLVCDICIVIKNIFAQVVTRMKVSISKFVSKVISIPNQHIKDRVVKIEEDEIKIEIREEVENNSERISNLCPAVCKTSKFLLRHKMEVMYFLIPKFA